MTSDFDIYSGCLDIELTQIGFFHIMASSDNGFETTHASNVTPQRSKTKKFKSRKPRSISVDMTSPEAEQQTDDDLEMSLTIASLKALASKPCRGSSDEERFLDRMTILGCSCNIESLIHGIRGHEGGDGCID